MTEKRFSIIYENNKIVGICENVYGENFEYLHHNNVFEASFEQMICDRLNNLAEENKQLLNEIAGLEMFAEKLKNKDFETLIANMKDLQRINERIREENEQLKQHINDTQIAVEIETEKCMERVFELINKRIRELEDFKQKYETDTPYLYIIYDLINLKKDLQR